MRSKNFKIVSTVMFAALIAVAPHSAYADSCSGQNYDNLGVVDPKDPCNEKKLKDFSAIQEGVSSAIHAMAIIPCTISCVSPLNITDLGGGEYVAEVGAMASVCTSASVITMVSDIGGAVLTQVESQKRTKKFDEQQIAGTMGMVVMGAIPMFAGLFGELQAADMVNNANQFNVYNVTEGANGQGVLPSNAPQGIESRLADAGIANPKSGSAICIANGTCGPQQGADQAGQQATQGGQQASQGGAPKQGWNGGACIAAIMHGLQSGMATFQSVTQLQQSKEADKNKKRAISQMARANAQALPGDTTASGEAPSVGLADGAGASFENEEHTGPTAEQMAAMASPEVQKLAKDFEKITGHSMEELMKLMEANGGNGVKAALALGGDKLSDRGKQLAAKINEMVDNLDEETRRRLLAEHERDLQNRSFVGNTPRKNSTQAASPLDSLNGLLASLMPKKEDEKKNDPSTLIQFGASRGPAARDGLHPPQRSIFEAVSERYSTVSKNFLKDGF